MKAIIVWFFLSNSAPVCIEYNDVHDAQQDYAQDQTVNYPELGLTAPHLLREDDATYSAILKLCRERKTN